MHVWKVGGRVFHGFLAHIGMPGGKAGPIYGRYIFQGVDFPPLSPL